MDLSTLLAEAFGYIAAIAAHWQTLLPRGNGKTAILSVDLLIPKEVPSQSNEESPSNSAKGDLFWDD